MEGPSGYVSFQPPSQALVSVFMLVPNWDTSLANATESLAQNNTATMISGHNLGSRSIKSSRLAVASSVRPGPWQFTTENK